ncbi:MAG: GTPase ObgE [Candidatus Omnitrophica bacterium]|nr:GTPase ObgE [Candidatus Omnitrophota bacterium]MCM8798131.1 GTPase ObgE [Candidatus Omnitrophota bacterium]
MRSNFIDYVEIEVKAGKGGDGCNSFFRHRFSRFPKPDGGAGGKGGDVVIIADENIHTLLDLQYRKRFVAEDGHNGEGNHKKGEAGRDCFILVPVGTLIKEAKRGFVLRDLTKPGEKVIVARGGEGGKGNRSGKPATAGKEGEEKRLILELKLIADVGLLGYPNVGKSTLLNRISPAHSKVASYPFTTRAPVLGKVEIGGEEFDFTVADIPGLIEGAHQGRGLGYTFLRHIERTKVLVHMVDISQSEGRDAYSDYLNLNRELFLYNPDLEKKPQLVVANKIDLSGAWDNLRRFSERLNKKIYPLSALTGEGVEQLLKAIKEILS